MSVLVIYAILSCVMGVWWWMSPRRRSPPKAPGALPFIGHAHQLLGDHKHLWNCFRNLFMCSLAEGGIVEFCVGPHSIYVYVITDPEAIQILCNTFLDRPYIFEFAKDFVSNGLVTVKASLWKSKRKLLNPSFNIQMLNNYVNQMNVEARSLVSRLALKVGNGSFDVRLNCVEYAMSTVTSTLIELNPQDKKSMDEYYVEALEDLLDLFAARFQKVWLHLSFIFNWSAMKRKQDQLTKKLKIIMDRVINERRNKLNVDKDPSKSDDLKPDRFKPILDQLLSVAEKNPDLTHNEIREHLDTLVIAAFDTTSLTLTFIMLLLGSHQDVQERVFNELQEVLEHKDGDISKHDLPKLAYMEAVIKETLRLYDPVPFSARKIDTDFDLKNYTLRAGSTWIIGTYGLLRHPMWGPDAEQFRPERWLDPSSLPDHPGLYASFGVGKRDCIGKRYAMMSIKVALAHIVRRYKITGDINSVVCQFAVVLKPVEGHHIALTLRT